MLISVPRNMTFCLIASTNVRRISGENALPVDRDQILQPSVSRDFDLHGAYLSLPAFLVDNRNADAELSRESGLLRIVKRENHRRLIPIPNLAAENTGFHAVAGCLHVLNEDRLVGCISQPSHGGSFAAAFNDA